MMSTQIQITLLMGLQMLGKFVAAFPDHGNWGVKSIDGYDVLYHWEANLNYTYDEAKTVCLRRNMPSRIFLEEIVHEIPDHNEFWAPHVFHLPQVVKISENKSQILQEFSGDAKGVICTATLRAAVVLFGDGTTSYVRDKPIPSYCYPQNAHMNENDLRICLLIIQKYEL